MSHELKDDILVTPLGSQLGQVSDWKIKFTTFQTWCSDSLCGTKASCSKPRVLRTLDLYSVCILLKARCTLTAIWFHFDCYLPHLFCESRLTHFLASSPSEVTWCAKPRRSSINLDVQSSMFTTSANSILCFSSSFYFIYMRGLPEYVCCVCAWCLQRPDEVISYPELEL